jgi:hypothetical protein
MNQSYEGPFEFGPSGETWEAEALGEADLYTEGGPYGEAEVYGEGPYGEAETYGEAPYGETTAYGETEMSVASRNGGTYEAEAPLSEVEEMELTAELLAVQSEAEMDQFLGNLFKTVARGAGAFLRSPAGRALGGILKDAARTALPAIGGAVGSFLAPGAGTAIGGRLGSALASTFEAEAEGLDPEQQEFDAARRLVQVGASAAQNAVQSPAGLSPAAAAQRAVAIAARQYLPAGAYGGGPGTRRRTGRWVRRGNAVIVIGA